MVVKNKRLRDYLYSLGFNYSAVPDRLGKQEEVYLFKDTVEYFAEAIEFYKLVKNSQKDKVSTDNQ